MDRLDELDQVALLRENFNSCLVLKLSALSFQPSHAGKAEMGDCRALTGPLIK
jgi:hypothetical protein